jgi:hypothetical protein
MRHTILQPFLATVMTLVALATPTAVLAQTTRANDEAFAAHAWHFEAEMQAALEAWNYNVSHEEIYAVTQGLTYGMRDGVVLRMNQRVAYVSQRAQDAVLLGLTIGVRGRVYQRGRVSAFLQGDIGTSYTAIATPPRGTRFNYLAAGGGGAMVRVHPRVHLLTTLQLIHISNAGVKGPGRNPDIEAIGPSLGLLFRF